MHFTSEQEALEWFLKDERVLTPAFIENIPWEKVKGTPVKADLVPILRYMRDIEMSTEVYYDELAATPTGKNPSIRAFMDRWVTEEPTHAELLHRFLQAAGETEEQLQVWKEALEGDLPKSYQRRSVVNRWIARLIGKRFGAIHMAWGAINEHSTLVGYKRLWEKAEHPVLEQILRGIVREEARHALFYWSVARIYLERYPIMRPVTRFVVSRFWSPVGQGIKPRRQTDYVVRHLFDGQEGVDFVDTHISERIRQLPGMQNLVRITERIAEASLDAHIAKRA